MTATHSLPNLGTQQSPIAVERTHEANIEVSINWESLVLSPKCDGYTPARKLSAKPGKKSGHLAMDGERYVPVDLHWHFPAEHIVGKKKSAYPSEVHIVHVHRDDVAFALQGKLDWCRIAVVGVFIKSGREPYAPMTVAVENDTKAVRVLREAILPSELGATRYRGSLTTPPYSENVTFILLDSPMTATKAQLADQDLPNARPLQACNRRFCMHGSVNVKT
ncbi:MAG: carbonic anhydrase family protein [Nannocystales bacterium]